MTKSTVAIVLLALLLPGKAFSTANTLSTKISPSIIGSSTPDSAIPPLLTVAVPPLRALPLEILESGHSTEADVIGNDVDSDDDFGESNFLAAHDTVDLECDDELDFGSDCFKGFDSDINSSDPGGVEKYIPGDCNVPPNFNVPVPIIRTIDKNETAVLQLMPYVTSLLSDGNRVSWYLLEVGIPLKNVKKLRKVVGNGYNIGKYHGDKLNHEMKVGECYMMIPIPSYRPFFMMPKLKKVEGIYFRDTFGEVLDLAVNEIPKESDCKSFK